MVFFSNTLVYSYLSEADHHTLVFWDIKNEKINYKYVKNMIDICAKSPFCLVAAQINDINYLLILSNSIGCPINNKIINVESVFIALNNTHIVVSNGHYVYLSQFRGIENERKKGRNDDKNIVIQGQEISLNLLTKKMTRLFL